MYGTSESVVGDLVSELEIRKSLFFATKVWTSGKEDGIQQMNRSFSRMKTQTMDLMQVHNILDFKTHVKTLKNWKEEGKIRYWGLTHYTVGSYPELMRIMQNDQPDFVQFNFNIRTRDAEKQILPLAQDKGIAVLINRPYGEGALFGRVKGKELPEWASNYDIKSWGQFFLKYIVSHPAVTCAIPGTSKVHHLEDNLQAAYGKLPDEKGRKQMADYFDGLG